MAEPAAVCVSGGRCLALSVCSHLGVGSRSTGILIPSGVPQLV